MSEKTAEKNTATKANARPGDQLVDYTAPLLPGQERQDIVVGVNGEIIRIRRGEQVKIKAKFVSVLDAAARQQVEAHQSSARAQKPQKLLDM